jgi:hypothetical protein
VSSEWKSAEDQLMFWQNEHKDCQQHSKLLLKKHLLLASNIYCLVCKVPKVSFILIL